MKKHILSAVAILVIGLGISSCSCLLYTSDAADE